MDAENKVIEEHFAESIAVKQLAAAESDRPERIAGGGSRLMSQSLLKEGKISKLR